MEIGPHSRRFFFSYIEYVQELYIYTKRNTEDNLFGHSIWNENSWVLWGFSDEGHLPFLRKWYEMKMWISEMRMKKRGSFLVNCTWSSLWGLMTGMHDPIIPVAENEFFYETECEVCPSHLIYLSLILSSLWKLRSQNLARYTTEATCNLFKRNQRNHWNRSICRKTFMKMRRALCAKH